MTRRIAIVALLAFPCVARAETQKSFTVGADIAAGCAVTADGSGYWGQINLGSINGATGGTTNANLLNSGVSGLNINCTPGTTVNVSADNGDHALAGTRRLVHATNAASFVSYALYANGSATPWTTQSIALIFPVGTSQKFLPVSAQAIVAAATRAGNYSDTVRVTVAW